MAQLKKRSRRALVKSWREEGLTLCNTCFAPMQEQASTSLYDKCKKVKCPTNRMTPKEELVEEKPQFGMVSEA